MDAFREAIKRGLFEAVAEIDRLNAARKGKHKLRSKYELAITDAAGNKEFVLPACGNPQWHPETETDPARFPNFAYVVATDGRVKIVIRIEYQRTIVQ